MDYKLLDEMISTATVNFYSLGKENKRIELNGFNHKDNGHLAIFRIALFNSLFFKYEVYLRMNFFRFLILKFKYRKKYKLHWLKEPTENYPSCNEFISFIEEANGCPKIFETIYEEYYK